MVNASERKKDPCWEMAKELEIEKEHEIVMEPEMEPEMKSRSGRVKAQTW